MKIFLKILLLFVCLASSLLSGAKGFSYVYIQGDKSTPFYVKFEDQMLPRYGKNYNIIPQLVPGPINIQILFQQNTQPAQRFTIMVPENGFRGFLLMKKGEVYTLYDIHQQFYLQPGNKAEDDHAPMANTADAYVYTNTRNEYNTNNIAPKTTLAATAKSKNTQPKFMTNIELNNERTVQYNTPPVVKQDPIEKEIIEEPVEEPIAEPEMITEPQQDEDPMQNEEPVISKLRVANSDCPAAISDKDFEDLYSKVEAKSEKLKLKFLLTKMTDCYTTNQARMLAEGLNNDPERYTLLKRVYPRVTDQDKFPALENLLSTQEWKSYFKLILPK